MPDQLTVSEQGLRLIKAFEGFRPVDRELVSGGRVVGYGHKVTDGRAMRVSEAEAEQLLRDDLAPFEDMLNTRVYAPLTQSQFDALASLAFNIGPKAFRDSDVLKAVNSGQPLAAAKAFDVWRLGRVGGEIFVIDALVRRRTAEKALFLRPPEDALVPKAPRQEIDVMPGQVADDPLPVLDRDGAGRIVMDAPYDIERLITSLPQRRVDDGPIGELAEAELPEMNLPATPLVRDPDPVIVEEPIGKAPVEPVRTAIAEAADEVRDRLEALMDVDDIADDGEVVDGNAAEDGPLLLDTFAEPDIFTLDQDNVYDVDIGKAVEPRQVSEDIDTNIVAFPDADTPAARIDLVDADAAMLSRPEIRVTEDWVSPDTVDRRDSAWPFVLISAVGGAMFGAGAAIRLRGLETIYGQPGDLVGLGLAMVGALIFLGGLIHIVKRLLDLDDR